MVPTVIIIHAALGRTTEFTTEKTIAATALSQSEMNAAQGHRFIPHGQPETLQLIAEKPHLDHESDRTHRLPASTGPASSMEHSSKIFPSDATYQPSLAESSGHSKDGIIPANGLPNGLLTRIDTENGTETGTWLRADGTADTLYDRGLELGAAAKSVQRIVPAHPTIAATRARIPTALEEGLGLFAEPDSSETSATPGGPSRNHGYTSADVNIGIAPDRPPISRIVTHPLPSPVSLVPPLFAATTFEAYVASLGYGNDNARRVPLQTWSDGTRTQPVRAQQASRQATPSRLERDMERTGS